jgi:hypothetical protein
LHQQLSFDMKIPALLIILALAQGEAVAQVMRWVDEGGVVNYGTTVPERYKNNARAVAVDKPPSESQHREAEARLRKEREALARPPAAPTPAASGDAGKAADKPAEKPAPARQEALSCEAQWREYDAAWECFNPYRNANGSVKPEGYERCPVVIQPECRP